MSEANDNNRDQVKAERHQQRQQKVKEAVDARVAPASEERGVLMVITGNGKGKSTAGFGTVARAVGHGKSAAVVQFIKGGWECGERNLLQKVCQRVGHRGLLVRCLHVRLLYSEEG